MQADADVSTGIAGYVLTFPVVSQHGVHVGPALRDFQGVLTGVPSFIGTPGRLHGDAGTH